MRNFTRESKATVVGAIVVASIGMGAAAAADVPVPEAELQAPSPEYNRYPPRYYGQEPLESYRPPAAVYGYPPPPPAAYYEPPIVVVPGPYYLPRRYGGLGYGTGPRGMRGYGPPAAGMYGRYDRPAYRGHLRW
jgi:hypothetical protein